MQLSLPVPAFTPVFDEPNLIASAGLVTAVGLAQQVGLQRLADEHVKVPRVGANAGLKVMSLVAGMCAGADSITDMGVLGRISRGFTETEGWSAGTQGLVGLIVHDGPLGSWRTRGVRLGFGLE